MEWRRSRNGIVTTDWFAVFFNVAESLAGMKGGTVDEAHCMTVLGELAF